MTRSRRSRSLDTAWRNKYEAVETDSTSYAGNFIVRADPSGPEVIDNFHTDYLYLTSVFVLVGLLRYIQIAVVDQKSGDPTKIILRDRITQFIVLAWLLSFLILIYIV